MGATSEAIWRGCNSPLGRSVAADWVEERGDSVGGDDLRYPQQAREDTGELPRSGYGSGSGSGDGSGYGSGYGDGSGYGSGYGSGSGSGYGSGYGSGDGSGDGSGYGYGSGSNHRQIPVGAN